MTFGIIASTTIHSLISSADVATLDIGIGIGVDVGVSATVVGSIFD